MSLSCDQTIKLPLLKPSFPRCLMFTTMESSQFLPSSALNISTPTTVGTLWGVIVTSIVTLLIILGNTTVYSSCSPDDPQCSLPASQPKHHVVSSSRNWQNRLIPAPLPGEDDFGVPISEITYNTELTSQSINESMFTLLLAGHQCHSDSECDSNLSCQFFSSPSFSYPSFVPNVTNRALSRLITAQIASSLPQFSEDSLCSRIHCNSTCHNLTAKSILCPSDSFIEERESDDQNCCIQT